MGYVPLCYDSSTCWSGAIIVNVYCLYFWFILVLKRHSCFESLTTFWKNIKLRCSFSLIFISARAHCLYLMFFERFGFGWFFFHLNMVFVFRLKQAKRLTFVWRQSMAKKSMTAVKRISSCTNMLSIVVIYTMVRVLNDDVFGLGGKNAFRIVIMWLSIQESGLLEECNFWPLSCAAFFVCVLPPWY